MIAYFLGIPGSGKTYYGVNVIFDNFANDIPKKSKLSLKKDYENCYTNINEFNFNKCHDVYHLDFDELLEKLTILYNLYSGIDSKKPDFNEDAQRPASVLKRKYDLPDMESAKKLKEELIAKNHEATKKKKIDRASDSELIEKAKELGIYKTLFIIDECHNFFDVQDKVKVWWLTYHRHLFHDIYLITQNLSLINSKYKPLAEAFYKAKSSSLTLNKRYFNYMYYTDSRLTKDSYVNTLKIPKNQKVFELYQSGDKVESKNVILRFIYIAIAFLVIVLIGMYSFYTSKEKEIKSHKVVSPPGVSSPAFVPAANVDYTDNILMIFKCDNTMCSYKDFYFNVKVLAFAKDNFDLEIIDIQRVFSYTYVSVSVSSEFLKFIKGGLNENSTTDAISVSDILGK